MPARRLSLPDLVAMARVPLASGDLSAASGTEAIVVDLDGSGVDPDDLARVARLLASSPCVTIGIRADPVSAPAPLAADVDVLLTAGGDATGAEPSADALDAILATVARHPLASTALALLLRDGESRSIEAGLVAESAVYSMLQAGPEFARWLAERTPRQAAAPDGGPPVRVRRSDDTLHVTLSRPSVHNAFSRAMRDAFIEALDLARADPSITRVLLDGDGPSFCSGGDLDEFGTAPDPPRAHLVRLTASAARLMAELSSAVEVRVHGACIGAGIELPAFAERVVAHPSARFALPEVSLGLIPGAGGTVSLPRRIGRQRTAFLALSGTTIDARTALRWGLVDDVDDRSAATAPEPGSPGAPATG